MHLTHTLNVSQGERKIKGALIFEKGTLKSSLYELRASVIERI